MSVKKTFYCDGPFNPNWPEYLRCPVHGEELDVNVVWGSLSTGRQYLTFCSWDCVLRYAAQIEPVEVIEA